MQDCVRDSFLRELRPIKMWHGLHVERGGVVFPTLASLEWFLRTHRDNLIRSGEFIPGRGGRPSLVGPGFDAVVLRELQNQAKSSQQTSGHPS